MDKKGMTTQSVLGIFVVIILIASLLPTLVTFVTAGNTSLGTAYASAGTLWTLIPLFLAIGVVVMMVYQTQKGA